jgi:hypothetical protein
MGLFMRINRINYLYRTEGRAHKGVQGPSCADELTVGFVCARGGLIHAERAFALIAALVKGATLHAITALAVGVLG